MRENASTDRPMTHELTRDEVYYKHGPQQAMPPDGTFQAGTRVRLENDAGSYSYVTSEDGIYAAVASDALKPLSGKK